MTAQSVTGIGPGDSGKRIAYLTEISEPLQFLTTTTNPQDLITGVPSGGGGGGGTGFLENNFFVAQNGNDSTGDGSISKPFLTVQAGIDAASAVASVSPTIIRPSVFVMPGTYNENITLKANVMVRGMEHTSTRIIGDIVLDNTFTPAGDWRSGFADLYIGGDFTADFNGLTSNEGKIYAFNTRFGGDLTFNAFSAINQFLMYGGEFFGTLTCNGMQIVLSGVVSEGGAIVLNAVANGRNIWQTAGGSLGSITVSQTTSLSDQSFCIFGHALQVSGVGIIYSELLGMAPKFSDHINPPSMLNVDGTFPIIYAATTSIPIITSLNLTNGATLSQLININDANLFTAPQAQVIVTTDYTIDSTEEVIFVNTTGGPVNLTLPNPAFYRKFKVKDVGNDTITNPINLVAFAGENIEGVPGPYIISSGFYPAVDIQSDGTNWWIMSKI